MPIQIDSSKVKKIFEKHPEMKSLICRVPEILHDPVIIMDSMTVKGSYVLLGNVLDENNNPVLVSIIPRPTNRRGIKLNVQKISSTYAKENAQHILDQSDVEYINPDKKNTANWQKLTRLQLPFMNLHAGGYINNIASGFEFDKRNENVRYSLNIDDDLGAVFGDNLDVPSGGLKGNGIRGEDVLKEGEEVLGSIHVSAADAARPVQKSVFDGETADMRAKMRAVQ